LLKGLQNYWTFDGHTNDVIGGANLVYGGPTTSFVDDLSGNSNSAVYLNSGYYSAPPGVYFSSDHTVAVWVKVIAVSDWARIVDFGTGTSDNVYLSTSSGSSGCPVSTIFGWAIMNQYATSSLALQLNQWTHLAHTYSSSTCKVYLNGTLKDTAACYAPRAVKRSNCYVGKSNWATDGKQNAQIDELRIYNRTLNLTEISQLVAYVPPGYTTTTTTASTTTSKASTTSSTTNFVAPSRLASATPANLANPTTTLSNSGTSTKKNRLIVDFSLFNNSEIISLLNSNYDLNGCIVNCSNSGQCKFDFLINNFFCSCNSIYLSGYACQIDLRPCSSNPCLNNATCVDFSNSGSYSSSLFSCVCDEYYEGFYCESKIDVCQNETCSSHGYCLDVNNKAKCACSSMYWGERCEMESNELKTAKEIISIASILAVVIIILFYIFIFLLDVAKFCCERKAKKRIRLVQKFTYKN
jgi:hypothetical protein